MSDSSNIHSWPAGITERRSWQRIWNFFFARGVGKEGFFAATRGDLGNPRKGVLKEAEGEGKGFGEINRAEEEANGIAILPFFSLSQSSSSSSSASDRYLFLFSTAE